MQIVIIFKSVTYAQRAERILAKKGITSNIIKAPFGKNAGSCAYGVKLNDKYIAQACDIIREVKLPYTDIMVKQPDGTYRRLEL